MLPDIVEYLVCPLCGADLAVAERALRCPSRHSFDIARQGYANLLPGDARTGTADTAEMVRARDSFLGAGHFAPVADLLAQRVSDGGGRFASERSVGGRCVLDAGAGTGYYLGAVLDRLPEAVGLALDISKYAARRAARAHPRIGAAVADLWRPLPVRSGSVDTIINVFAPRNAAEFRRVLRPSGALHVVAPTARHLDSLVDSLGLLSVDEEKSERMELALGGNFEPTSQENLETAVSLSRDDVATLVGMGPSAHHIPAEELAERAAKLPDPIPVTLSFVLTAFRPLRQDG
ncbi:putative RNA methyltransferase [Actinomadura rudentiformis]|uniref:Methyltransferase domain-containing protein n=1 Tax=Actinomadura rudentiformis TaxID=359158 RepID=A0A6H9Z0X7_9ACTN|nr:methyltransferase domain-containing protein [Actinomadura rudentiformis]KAB2346775.1 methyltransferase domain-containing protein [Actinomadura rudentiformis]